MAADLVLTNVSFADLPAMQVSYFDGGSWLLKANISHVADLGGDSGEGGGDGSPRPEEPGLLWPRGT